MYAGDDYGSVDRFETYTTDVDRMKCYKAKARGSVRRSVMLADSIQQGPATLGRLAEVCAPATMEGQAPDEGVVKPDARLACYKLSRPSPTTVPPAPRLANEIEGRSVGVRRARSICVPSHSPDVAAPPGVDHFACYRVSGFITQGFDMRLSDTLGGTLPARFFRLDTRCVPVSQDGGVIGDPDDDLLCFELQRRIFGYVLPWPKRFPTQTFTLTNELGDQSVSISSPTRFCTPARAQ